jgi:hypothetical protein
MIPFDEAVKRVFDATYDWRTMTSAPPEVVNVFIRLTGWNAEEFRLKLAEACQNHIDDVDRTLGEHS